MFINEIGDWLDDWSSNAIYYINKKNVMLLIMAIHNVYASVAY